MKAIFTFLFIFQAYVGIYSQQISDTSFHPQISHPAYDLGKGPIVFIDEGHHNFHTKDGRYLSFARSLEQDGYTVESFTGAFEKEKLDKGKILVISNALNELNTQNWYLPTPSAFTEDEIKTLKDWVNQGGILIPYRRPSAFCRGCP